ncbi:hypothetical protein [Pseudogemmobacter sp. W21_MBD1_M6]
MIRKYLGPHIERFMAAKPVQPFLFALGVVMILGGALYTVSSIFF